MLKRLPRRASMVPQPSRFARIHPTQQIFDADIHDSEFVAQGE
jgi:hypothetical protein